MKVYLLLVLVRCWWGAVEAIDPSVLKTALQFLEKNEKFAPVIRSFEENSTNTKDLCEQEFKQYVRGILSLQEQWALSSKLLSTIIIIKHTY